VESLKARGSIPIHWTQEMNNMTPKPPLQIKYKDPYFSSTVTHFKDLLTRYGGPVTILNLVKQTERFKRECILTDEFKNAIDYCDQWFPNSIKYHAYDLARAAKT
jgi:hypothetical protein